MAPKHKKPIKRSIDSPFKTRLGTRRMREINYDAHGCQYWYDLTIRWKISPIQEINIRPGPSRSEISTRELQRNCYWPEHHSIHRREYPARKGP